MKKQIKKTIFITAIAAFAALMAFGKTTERSSSLSKAFQNKKPVKTTEVILKGKPGPKSISTLQSDTFTADGKLNRKYKGKVYTVLVCGHYCYYFLEGLTEEQMNNVQHYSEGITGDLMSFDDKVMEKLLQPYGLVDAYKNDKPKREFKDSVNDYFNKRVERNVKYFKVLNKKFK